MSPHFANWDERTRALALDELSFGLSAAERDELRARITAHELEELELAIAELHVAALGELEAPPAEVQQRVFAAARARMEARASGAGGAARPASAPALRAAPAASATRADQGAASPPTRIRSARGWRPVLALAALVLAVLFVERWRARPLDPAQRRERLIARASDLVRASWARSDDPLALQLEGELVWSPSLQEGYMSFRGLPANDPRLHQYQLWIFDATRADWEAKPVDGGVFDAAAGDVSIVPIDAKLEVRSAALFALTLEAPGGVVVSTREQLLATAKP
jgi:hypothetical protein